MENYGDYSEFYLINVGFTEIDEKKYHYIEVLDLPNRYFFKVYGKEEDFEPYQSLDCFSPISKDCFKLTVKNGQLKYALNK